MKLSATFAIACLLMCPYDSRAQVSTAEHSDHAAHQSGEEAGMMHPADMPKHMQMMNKMMVKHLGKADGEYDARLIDMMIPHHEGAVMMLKDAQTKSTHPEMKAMAAKMIAQQQKEIVQLKKWRDAWYGAPTGTR